jgi:hypothetical protein
MLDPYQQHSGYLEDKRFASATKNSLSTKKLLWEKEKAGIDLIIFLLSILEFSLEEYVKQSNKWSILFLESKLRILHSLLKEKLAPMDLC